MLQSGLQPSPAMATLKLKHTSPNPPHKAAAREGDQPSRPPVRGAGAGVKKRLTLAETQVLRAEREARYQQQLQQRYGDRPPAEVARRGDPRHAPRQDSRPDRAQANTAFGQRAPDHPLPRRPQQPTAGLEHTPGSMRLSKRMSELGIASRREADEWIAKGWVRVDGQVVKELGSRVVAEQHVTVDAQARYQQAQRVTVLVNKPVGYVSGQAEDGYEPAVVLVTPQNQWREDRSGTRFLREHLKSLVPAGRLDIDSVGLLVLTQDGRVAKQLIGEDSDIEKEYLVRVEPTASGTLTAESLALLNHGLELDGEALRPARVEWVNEDQLRFVLKQGKKRQIRRMCEAVGLKVLGLKRVRVGAVMLGELPAGQWRYLRMDEKFA
jgi:23S rRNA pseudouridine2604 synthase